MVHTPRQEFCTMRTTSHSEHKSPIHNTFMKKKFDEEHDNHSPDRSSKIT